MKNMIKIDLNANLNLSDLKQINKCLIRWCTSNLPATHFLPTGPGPHIELWYVIIAIVITNTKI